MSIDHVCIVGGTHGNELTGIYLTKSWQKCPAAVSRESFSTATYLANPVAAKENVRYIEADLNRQFSLASLHSKPTSYEQKRAQEINQELGPKGNASTDFILDLHTTTANMGVTLSLSCDSPFHRRLVAHIKSSVPDAHIIFEPREKNEDYFLMSVADYSGLLIEVGPTAQGILRHDTFDLSAKISLLALDFIEKYNSGEKIELPKLVEAYQFVEKVEFPKDENGDRSGYIHDAIQDKDYEPIMHDQPLFFDLQRKVITYQGESGLCPVFVNEAAYYDQNHAFSLMRKVALEIP